MQLSLQDFTALVKVQAAAVAQSARTLMDVSVGSVLRAVLEANASVALWMQWLIMEVLSTTRAATSQGADLDSWVADFGLTRLPAVAATGTVTFSRITPGLAVSVPVGAVVRTGAGSDAQAFLVTGDAGRAGWNGAGYTLNAQASAITVPVQAQVAGRAGNVQAGVVRLLSTAVPGIDGVTNENAASGGLDAETDAALRSRFAGFLDSRTRATAQAVGYAINSVQQGLQYILLERVDSAGVPRAGHFTVVLDDGSGAPSDATVAAVAAAIDMVRPLGGSFSVRRPLRVGVDIAMQVSGPDDAKAGVAAAVGGFVAGLGIGASVAISRLIQVAHEADVRVASVSGVSINGGTGDLAIPAYGRAVPGSVVVS